MSSDLRKFLRKHWDVDWSGFWIVRVALFPVFLVVGLIRKSQMKAGLKRSGGMSPTSSRGSARPLRSPTKKIGLDVSAAQLMAVVRIQRTFRNKFYRFDRIRLIDRLKIEMNFISTSIRLGLFVLLFISVALMLDAVSSVEYRSLEGLHANGFSTSSFEVFKSEYPSMVQSAFPAQFAVDSNLVSEDRGVSVTPCDKFVISGFLKANTTSSSDFVISESSCLTWSTSNVSISDGVSSNIVEGLDIIVSTGSNDHVSFVLNESLISVYLNGAMVGSGVVASVPDCVFEELHAPAIAGVSRSGFTAYTGDTVSEEDVLVYLPRFGIPKLFLESSTLPPTEVVNFGKVGLTTETPPIEYVAGGVVVRGDVVEYLVTEKFLGYGENGGVRFVHPILLGEEKHLVIYELFYDELGFPSSKYHHYITYQMGLGELVTAFVLNIVVVGMVLCLDLGTDWKNVKNLFVLIPDVVFAISFLAVTVHAGRMQDGVVGDLRNAMGDAKSFIEIIDAQIIPVVDLCENLEIFGTIFVLYLILWRIISFMRIHPRIALFVNTMSAATGEIFHFLITFFIVASGMAIIGIFTFDYDNAEYTSFQGALYMLFHVMLGDDWSEVTTWRDSWEGILYFVLLPVLVIFTLLNFLLAVIIDTYVKVREISVERNFSHQSIFLEVIDIPKSVLMFFIFQFPSRARIVEDLEKMDAVRIVKYSSLVNVIGVDATKFAQFYHGFWFLKLGSGGKEIGPTAQNGLSPDESTHLINSPIDDSESHPQQLQFIAKQLQGLLVALHLKRPRKMSLATSVQSSMGPSPTPPPSLVIPEDPRTKARNKIINEYQAARTIQRLTRAHVRSRHAKEYMQRARQDAELLISHSSHSSGSNHRRGAISGDQNIFRSLVLTGNESYAHLDRNGSRASIHGIARRSSFNLDNIR